MVEVTHHAVSGTLRSDKRTKDLVRRLVPGEIALILHPDLDATAARGLVEAGVAAVVNAAQSITGKYPNRGPSILADAGIPLLDDVSPTGFEAAAKFDGVRAILSGENLCIEGGPVLSGSPMTNARVESSLAIARSNLGRELQAFARNTLEYIEEEKSLLLDPVDLPDIRTDLRDKHVLIVVRGEGYKEDLAGLHTFIEEVQPVLIGVDGGADALLEMGLKPQIILGDMDSVTDHALKCGAELIVHGYVRGNRGAPGKDRMDALGLQSLVFHAPGTSEDVAILLADEKGAAVIVAVGTHFSLVEFLDKGRGGMASTFLIRLRTGAKLVDAKGIGRLWTARTKPATRELVFLFCAALFPIVVIALYSPWIRTVLSTVRLKLAGR